MNARIAWSAWFLVLGTTVLPTRADEHKPIEPTLPKGMRAFAVKVTIRAAETGLILPKSKVDVVATTRNADGKEESRVILANVVILAVDTLQEPPKARDELINHAFVLLVTPDQAKKVIEAKAKAAITLVRRKPDDDKTAPNDGTKER